MLTHFLVLADQISVIFVPLLLYASTLTPCATRRLVLPVETVSQFCLAVQNTFQHVHIGVGG